MTGLRCAGVDGCRRGWLIATRAGVEVVTDLQPALHHFDVVGIDMPIGLPDDPPRAADVQARRFVSPWGSSVFPALPRPLLHLDSYAEANAHSRLRFGQGLPAQAWALHARLREVDDLMRPDLEDSVVEVHPECSFRLLVGHPLPSKHSPDGAAIRRLALEDQFGSLPPCPPGARDDDLFDAFAVLWSAERFARAQHVTWPAEVVERDGRGLVMRIIA